MTTASKAPAKRATENPMPQVKIVFRGGSMVWAIAIDATGDEVGVVGVDLECPGGPTVDEALEVDPAYRRRGVATMLWNAVQAWVYEQWGPYEVHPGTLTDDGLAWWNSDREVVPSPQGPVTDPDKTFRKNPDMVPRTWDRSSGLDYMTQGSCWECGTDQTVERNPQSNLGFCPVCREWEPYDWR